MSMATVPPGDRQSGAEHLNRVWHETADRVDRFLRTRGVSATDDILQEVAIRVLRSEVPFRDADDLVPWACVVAWRIYIGEYRRQRRTREDLLIVDVASRESVEDTAASRLQLTAVLHAISTLNARDRRLLLATMTERRRCLDHREAGRAAVARYRARARLIKALGQPPA